jgi:hypothetical protein
MTEKQGVAGPQKGLPDTQKTKHFTYCQGANILWEYRQQVNGI